MCLTTTTSGEATQMPTSASSKWGLGREVWTASSVFWVRNRLECPEDSLRGLIWLPFRALYPWKQGGRCATARDGSQRATAISAPETAFPTKLWAGCQLLITSSWDPGGSHQTRVSQPEISSPEETYSTPGTVLMVHPRNQEAGTGEVNKMHSPPGTVHSPSTQLPQWLGPVKGSKHTANLGLCPHGTPKNLCSLGLECARNAGLTWDSAFMEHPGAWAVWTQEVHATLSCGKPSVVHPI